ncbi:MAG: hypothetical protein N3F66_01095 [Spirochaetes bacterium]|nr:hypothetical protein [Spirochaetota bacterium]
MIRKIISYIFLVAIAHSMIACSYTADYIEGALTNRASFSISARYESGTGVIVEWTTNPNEDSFAGYEIYMTKEANNEFSDMIVVGACYSIGSSYFQTDSTLDSSSTSQFTHTALPPSGIYFYRVGVIDWDERDYDGDGKDDKKPLFPNQTLYESYTHIAKISGSAMVVIP